MGEGPTWYPTWIFFGQVSNVELTYSFWFHLKVPFWDGLVRPLHLESFYGDIWLKHLNLQVDWKKAYKFSESRLAEDQNIKMTTWRPKDVFIFSVSWAICLLFQLLGSQKEWKDEDDEDLEPDGWVLGFLGLGKNQYPPDAPIYGLFMERRWKRRPHSRGPNVGKMAEAMACFDEMFPDWMHPDEVGPFWHNTPREVEENTGGQDEKWNMCVFFVEFRKTMVN